MTEILEPGKKYKIVFRDCAADKACWGRFLPEKSDDVMICLLDGHTHVYVCRNRVVSIREVGP